jgi:hypothetical protein
MNAVIGAHAKVGDKEGAVVYFNMLTQQLKLKPDIITMTSLINAHKQSKDKAGAMKYFKIMIEEFQIKPDIISMTAVLYAIVRDKSENAIEYFKEIDDFIALMDSMNIKKNSYVYFALMEACKYQNDKKRSIFWFDDLISNNVQYDAYAWGEVCHLFKSIIGLNDYHEYKKKHEQFFNNREKFVTRKKYGK